ncbi:MAG: C_GCAxxG_C_C family protein, partial [Deltaproteobacteria bacterium]|nr:C_GCAxxG_C_C family protein [Deltaproteobacteria bacterium]
ALGAFGGGIAGTGRVCGILVGGVALISSIYSRSTIEEKENPRMWPLSYKFVKKFEKLTQSFGGVDCHDIARVDWKNREETKEFYSNPESRRKFCIQLVGDAAYVLGELLEAEKVS